MSGKPWDMRCGRWQDVMADTGMVDAVICDPPYGARTHAGNQEMSTRFAGAARADLHYAHWAAADVTAFVAHWATRCQGWFACMTSDDLIGAWRLAYTTAGLLDFAPVPILQPRVRLGGDGPASAAVYLMVARPRRRQFLSWGALPGWYMAGIDRGPDAYIGGKPIPLMRAIVRDYSRPGDVIADPCAGAGTTLIAACQEGRTAIGAEMDPTTANRAVTRLLRANLAPPLFFDRPHAEQSPLALGPY